VSPRECGPPARLHRLCDVGGAPGQPLLRRPLPEPLLLAGGVHRPVGPRGRALWHAWGGEFPAWWPAFVPASPAILILVFPGLVPVHLLLLPQGLLPGLRRVAPGCAVGPWRKRPYRARRFLLFQNLHRYALYFALALHVHPVLRRRSWPSPTRGSSVSAWAASCCSSTPPCSRATPSAATRSAISSAATTTACPAAEHPKYSLWKRASWLNARHMQLRLGEPGLGRPSPTSTCARVDGRHHRPQHLGLQPPRDPCRTYPRSRHSSTTWWSSAPVAPVYAPPSSAAPRARHRRRVQEPARQGPHGHGRGRHGRGARQRRPATTGRCTSATPCAAASSSTTGAWPSSTPSRRRSGCASSRSGGGVRSHQEGLISQRNFGGHRYPRLAHVGDRTGLELIRTLQDHGVHQGIDVPHGVHGLELLKDGERIAGSPAYWRETGRFVSCSAPRRSSSPPAAAAAPGR
jgi:hypothetical protein